MLLERIVSGVLKYLALFYLVLSYEHVPTRKRHLKENVQKKHMADFKSKLFLTKSQKKKKREKTK